MEPIEHDSSARLFAASDPAGTDDPVANQLATQLVVQVRPQAKRHLRRARAGWIAAIAAGSLALGSGAAFALPELTKWWLWVPDDDWVMTSEPFVRDGTVITCNAHIRVVTDGKTATDDTVERLEAARRFLHEVDPRDYQDAEPVAGDSEFWMQTQPELRPIRALTQAITLDLIEQGYVGEGVAVESWMKCPPPA